jgi:hypothetical protein
MPRKLETEEQKAAYKIYMKAYMKKKYLENPEFKIKQLEKSRQQYKKVKDSKKEKE